MSLGARLCSLRRIYLLFTGVFVLGLFMMFAAASAQAASGINHQISYQGKLLDSSGVAVANGVYQMKFSVYGAGSGGAVLWTASGTVATPTAIPITVQNGLFSVMLGDTSASGGWQNGFDGFSWNNDNIYLGVTIGTDGEMTPRKRMGAVPQAFNAERLQGMYASSSVSGGQSLFTVNQTENTAATGTRTALVVRSNGTSDQNDLLIRGMNDLDAQVFSVGRQGTVTSTGSLVFTGSGTSTVGGSLNVSGNVSTTHLFADGNFQVNGNVTLGESPADQIRISGRIASSLYPLTDAAYNFGAVSLRWNEGYFVSVSSTYTTSTWLYAEQAFLGNTSSTNLTATSAVFAGTSSTNAYADRLEFQSATGSLITANQVSALNDVLITVTSTSDIPLLSTVGLPATGMDFRMDTQGRYAYVTQQSSASLKIVDLTDPAQPGVVSVTALPTMSAPKDIAVAGKYAYVALHNADQLLVLDISNASSVRQMATLAGLTGITELEARGSYLYAGYSGNLAIIDVSSSTQPKIVSTLALSGSIQSLDVAGGYAYIPTSASEYIVSLADPHHPVTVQADVGSMGGVRDMRVQGRYLYAVENNSGTIKAFDVADPAAPVLVGSRSLLSSSLRHVRVYGSLAIVALAADPSLMLIDISDPSNLRIIKTLSTGGSSFDAQILGRSLIQIPVDDQTIHIYRLPGVQATTVQADTLESGFLRVRMDGSIAGALTVGDGLVVGGHGITSQGALRVDGANATSVIQGNLFVGTSTIDVATHPLFHPDGDDLFVAGNIGSASSVYTNGSFIAGTGSTFYNAGSIINNIGDFAITSASGFVTGNTDGGMTLGSPSVRFNANFLSVTTTNLQVDQGRALIRSASAIPLVSSVAFVNLFGDPVPPGKIYQNERFAIVQHVPTDQYTILDVSSSTHPVSLGIYNGEHGGLTDVVLQNYFMFSTFVSGNYFSIVDLKNGSLVELGNITFSAIPRSLAVQGRYAYILLQDNTLQVVDVVDPAHPVIVSSHSVPSGTVKKILVRGRYAYVAIQNGGSSDLYAYDISSPSVISPAGTAASISATFADMVSQGSFLYTADSQGVNVFSIRNGGYLAYQGSHSSAAVNSLAVSGRYLFASLVNTGIGIFDIENTVNLELIQTISSITPVGVAVRGKALYVPDTFTNTLRSYLLPGFEVAGLDAGSANIGSLYVQSNGLIGQSLDVGEGLSVGYGGIRSEGTLGVGSLATSTFAGDLLVQHAFAVSGTTQLSNTVVSGTSASLIVNSSSTEALSSFTNRAGASLDTSWGAYINRLLVGPNSAATGTASYSMVLNYNALTSNGLCLTRDNSTACPGIGGSVFSLVADDVISSSDAFDLAESYRLQGVATTTDVLVFGSASTTVAQSSGIAYDPHIAGVYSSDPGFLLGILPSGVPVALTGRVPTKVSPINGGIAIGDPLTTSEYPGVAMKATKPGMILGYALEAASATSTIEVFVKTGYSAASILNTDGRVARLTDDLMVDARATATVGTPAINSWGLTFRGSAWSGSGVTTPSFGLLTEVATPTSSSFVIRNSSSSSIFAINQYGTATIGGDLFLGGRLYPGGRGGAQQSKYLFLEDASTSTQYIATNADGWQANDSYDFAERYYSPDRLETGDLVVASDRGRFHVQRSLSETGLLMGIVSTKPAFVAGRPDPDTYPIALAGRVPTKVSTMNGAIRVGDPLGPSTIPGTAVKATKAGPIVGLALEAYDMPTVGKIEVFVNPGWWGGPKLDEVIAPPSGTQLAPTRSDDAAKEVAYRGFALVESGSKRVHVAYDSVLSYPNIQVTPRGQVQGGWWTDNYTDIGFDIFLHQVQLRDVTFAWSAEGTPTGARVYRSDGTYALVNPTTGEALIQTLATSTEAISPEPIESPRVAPIEEHATTTAPSILVPVTEVSSSTPSVVLEPETPPSTVDTSSTVEELVQESTTVPLEIVSSSEE